MSSLTPSDDPDLPVILDNLAVPHVIRFERQGEPKDLETAVKYATQAISLTPEDHPQYSRWQINLVVIRLVCLQHTGDISHLWLARDLSRRAFKSSYAEPHMKFKSAQVWADLISLFDPDEYQTTIDLLPQVIWLGSTTNSKRYDDLLVAGALAANAASAAIRFSDYSLALEWLERTRCVVWNQHLMLRSPVDRLLSINPDLATRIQEVATQLRSAGSKPLGGSSR